MSSSGRSGGQLSGGTYRKYAVSWFFRVAIDGGSARDLGNWSSCTGLNMSLKATEVNQGGVYDEQYYLPDQVTYGKVVLERAIERTKSTVVRKWLKEVVDGWINGDGEPYAGSNVTITLFDNVDHKVMSWTLRNAIPTQWTGPQLNASGSTVATEKLELTHQGFL